MIKINDTYVIDVGANNYVLCKDEHKKNKKGKDIYTPISYHARMDAALCKALSEMVKNNLSTSDMIELKDAVEIIKKTHDELREIIDKAFNIEKV